jgi:hypothetical protein
MNFRKYLIDKIFIIEFIKIEIKIIIIFFKFERIEVCNNGKYFLFLYCLVSQIL